MKMTAFWHIDSKYINVSEGHTASINRAINFPDDVAVRTSGDTNETMRCNIPKSCQSLYLLP
jgi:hypothetical protein